ncbi:hypothetical protein B1F73_00075 [Pseudomonas syringae]|uniref:DUF2147 domain-containing protein n=2 Tax=Pseudomonas syringae TaxID=317 RepID=A0AB37ZMZ5_PSESX|nr:MULTISPECIES: DUF2147 domain-containing protein [Pseudomonas]MBI6665494.1 DUF2147 domain-containing protein [Pseudomonas syringae]MBI6678041.1 DUF2147 domain-containing protein [Pseudomonas syringae]MBI6836478.1 DUF2147 domain-containing protein [Pseudomonas syringae]MCK9701001.1 DUF2147 domain-containing protein [Pseudomonas syringae pv. syringae]MCK9756496.1 DUF2147 domain-containing protein [Pseudomonas syringae pv. syringae]
MNVRQWLFLSSVLMCSTSIHAAAGPLEAKGLWLTAEKDAVVRLDDCADKTGAICGQIVWVKDAASTSSDCGVQILQLTRYDQDAWRDGWVYDPRDQKKYKGAVRVKDGRLNVRAFVGTEVLGKTEQFERIATLPPAPVCKS